MLEAISFNTIMNYTLTMIIANVCERERERGREREREGERERERGI